VSNPFSGTDDAALSLKMVAAMDALRHAMNRNGDKIDSHTDPNRTGFIGLELTPLTTSLGSLVSKRTATNPRFASVVRSMLIQAGVKAGENVAIVASGSFPSLILASVLAAESLPAQPLLISSIGSSTWGANRTDWTWLDMERVFLAAGIIQTRTYMTGLGGSADQGPQLFESGVAVAFQAAHRNGVPVLRTENLNKAIEQRLALFMARKPVALINVGGSHVALGGCPHGHTYPGGLIKDRIACNHPDRGLIIRFLEADVPVINMLNIPALARKHGLKIDPVPFQ